MPFTASQTPVCSLQGGTRPCLYASDQSANAFVMRIEAVRLAGAVTHRGNWQVGGPAPVESNFPLGAFSSLYGGGDSSGEYGSKLAPYGVIDHMTGTLHLER